MVLVKKAKQKVFSNIQICHNYFYVETQPGLEITVCPIFAKLVLGIFEVCLLVRRMNLSHTQIAMYAQKSKLIFREGGFKVFP